MIRSRRVPIPPCREHRLVDIRLDGDWQINETLLHLLATEYHLPIEAETLLDAFGGPDDGTAPGCRWLRTTSRNPPRTTSSRRSPRTPSCRGDPSAARAGPRRHRA
jgi:hypothetical protein